MTMLANLKVFISGIGESIKKTGKWHSWFAWYPVPLGKNNKVTKYAWGRLVERRVKWDDPYDPEPVYSISWFREHGDQGGGVEKFNYGFTFNRFWLVAIPFGTILFFAFAFQALHVWIQVR